MSMEFSNVTILGSGLLGGSLAMALDQQHPSARVRLWARRQETVDQAISKGIEGATTDLKDAVKDAELLILAIPVGAMASLVEQAIQAGLPSSCIISDVGSVKQGPHDSISEVIANTPYTFIGSHPMAGSEQGGIETASAELFSGAACLMTNDNHAPDDAAFALEAFWQKVGCYTKWTDAQSHDLLVAKISHLPHIVAAATAMVCLQSPKDGVFGGGGLRDTTRIAAGNPDMWAEILTQNRKAITQPLKETILQLQNALSLLESGNQDATRQWLAEAKDLRDVLNQKP